MKPKEEGKKEGPGYDRSISILQSTDRILPYIQYMHAVQRTIFFFFLLCLFSYFKFQIAVARMAMHVRYIQSIHVQSSLKTSIFRDRCGLIQKKKKKKNTPAHHITSQ